MIPLHHAVSFQHIIWDDVLPTANFIIDATCGNGHDLLYISQHLSPKAKLIAIDIQPEAIKNSQKRIELEGKNKTIDYYCSSHDDILSNADIITNNIDLLIFNLGYLPRGNHQLMTQSTTTIRALDIALPLLSTNGVITIVSYPGTEEGAQENQDVANYLSSINQKEYHISCWTPLNQVNQPPILYIIRRR